MATLDEMVLAAKQRAGMENSDVLSAQEWIDNIQRGNRAFYEKLITAWQREHFAKKRSVTVDVGQTELPGPGDMLVLLNVYVKIGDRYRPLKSFELYDEPKLLNTVGSVVPEYRYMAGKFYFAPPPNESFTMYMWYVPKTPKIQDAEDVYNVNGWNEWVEVHAAQIALIKEGSVEEAAALATFKQEVEARITMLAPNLDTTPFEIIDEDSEHYLNEWFPFY